MLTSQTCGFLITERHFGVSQGDDSTNNRAVISVSKGLYSRERSHTHKSWGLYIFIKGQVSHIDKRCGEFEEWDHTLGRAIVKHVIVEVRIEMSLEEGGSWLVSGNKKATPNTECALATAETES